MKVNLDNERQGLRYGSRVVVGVDQIIISGIKFRALWLKCDCGDLSLVQKGNVLRGRANRCVQCKHKEAANGKSKLRD